VVFNNGKAYKISIPEKDFIDKYEILVMLDDLPDNIFRDKSE